MFTCIYISVDKVISDQLIFGLNQAIFGLDVEYQGNTLKIHFYQNSTIGEVKSKLPSLANFPAPEEQRLLWPNVLNNL